MAKVRTKGEIFTQGGKQFVSLGRGGARRVNQGDVARSRIKRETASGKAPPIPQPSSGPSTQKELDASRARSAARKKKRVVKPRPDAIQNQPTTQGVRLAFEQAAQAKKDAARKRNN